MCFLPVFGSNNFSAEISNQYNQTFETSGKYTWISLSGGLSFAADLISSIYSIAKKIGDLIYLTFKTIWSIGYSETKIDERLISYTKNPYGDSWLHNPVDRSIVFVSLVILAAFIYSIAPMPQTYEYTSPIERSVLNPPNQWISEWSKNYVRSIHMNSPILQEPKKDLLQTTMKYRQTVLLDQNFVKDAFAEYTLLLGAIAAIALCWHGYNLYQQIKPPPPLTEAEFTHRLADDVVLKEYTCPITRDYPLDPVLDPTNGITIYDRKAIVESLDTSITYINDRAVLLLCSPMTNKPLKPEDLVPLPCLKAHIESRLAFHNGFKEKYKKNPTLFTANLQSKPEMALTTAAREELSLLKEKYQRKLNH